MGKREVIHKTGCTQHIATLPKEDRATATVDMRKNLVHIDHVVPEIIIFSNRQTHTQTDVLIVIFISATGAEQQGVLVYCLPLTSQ